jgi:hypothetical protein
MSSTAKARLQALFAELDSVFANVHRDDVPEMIAEIRRDLSNRNSGKRSGGFDKHSNSATSAR